MALIVAALLIIGGPIGLLVRQQARRETDVGRAPAMQGTGTVLWVTPVDFNRVGQPLPARLGLRFQGIDYSLRSDDGFNGLRPGSTTDVTYRVGRSGQVYIERVDDTFVGQR